MSLVEFLEDLARAADVANLTTPILANKVLDRSKMMFVAEDASALPLWRKLESAMALLFTLCPKSAHEGFQ